MLQNKTCKQLLLQILSCIVHNCPSFFFNTATLQMSPQLNLTVQKEQSTWKDQDNTCKFWIVTVWTSSSQLFLGLRRCPVSLVIKVMPVNIIDLLGPNYQVLIIPTFKALLNFQLELRSHSQFLQVNLFHNQMQPL